MSKKSIIKTQKTELNFRDQSNKKMKVLSLFTSVLAGVSITSALYAPPRKLYRRQASEPQNSTSSSGVSAGSFTPNGTNSTQPQVFFAGNDHQNVTNKTSQNILNVTGTLDITQLYDVASRVNSTLQNSTQGIVIVADPSSIESLSFFSSILFSQTYYRCLSRPTVG